MNLEAFAEYGLPGLILAAAVGLLYALIRRGVKVRIEAEIPPKE
jgi:hypothetical protein